jgi:hypothetical protein
LTYAISINKEALNETIEDYKNVKFTPEQKVMIEKIATYVGEFLDIPEMVRKVLTWKSQHEWQLKYNKTIAEIINMPTNEKIVAVKELFTIGKKNLKNILSNRKEQELLVDVAFERAYKLYLIQAESDNCY